MLGEDDKEEAKSERRARENKDRKILPNDLD